MSNHPKLGEQPTLDCNRDAVHVAIFPAMASEPLNPGDKVSLIGGYYAESSEKPDGVVDPFLSGPIGKGDRFWLLLNPGAVTDLRHSWTHPSIPDEELDEDESEDNYDGCNGC
jgi:hypothetical protein